MVAAKALANGTGSIQHWRRAFWRELASLRGSQSPWNWAWRLHVTARSRRRLVLHINAQTRPSRRALEANAALRQGTPPLGSGLNL
ncbi:hypothetical protein N7519_001209 [Penicillium mononematosum]|uniref:uncharacterized protein n=1 Tax=Penicillium mononematosum TaxID=268346 RepID=UPI0025479AC2|nr:uncharacterized protein N7519_001209 [Penicillium mononematosum]KAJ6191188.1 hypothetical protein N7519_001209 [Penicillium mononematosum]